jgi:uncharacterized protein with HEPN domain
MKHPERVEDYLEHIAEAITRATRYIEPLQGIEAFRQNQLVQDGVVRNIEIIGEAANHINRIAPEFVPGASMAEDAQHAQHRHSRLF